jgi:hypothetical protein
MPQTNSKKLIDILPKISNFPSVAVTFGCWIDESLLSCKSILSALKACGCCRQHNKCVPVHKAGVFRSVTRLGILLTHLEKTTTEGSAEILLHKTLPAPLAAYFTNTLPMNQGDHLGVLWIIPQLKLAQTEARRIQIPETCGTGWITLVGLRQWTWLMISKTSFLRLY